MSPDFRGILEALVKHEVNFLVTGGISAVVQGAPITTFDVDIVHERTSKNVEKLISALTELDARYRTRKDLVIRPEASTLLGTGHHLFMTKFGPLDVLGSIGNGRIYDELEVETMTIGTMTVRVQSLRSLIEVKEEIGMEKDKAVLPILKRTLEERQKK